MAKLPAGHLVINPPLTGKRLLDCMAQGEPLQLPTPGGCVLTMSRVKDKLSVTDQSGQTARITNADVVQSNGMMEMIDRVLLPAD